jgi:hypothetical protein
MRLESSAELHIDISRPVYPCLTCDSRHHHRSEVRGIPLRIAFSRPGSHMLIVFHLAEAR